MIKSENVDAKYNKIQSNYPYQQMLDESNYVLEEYSNYVGKSTYIVQKQPMDSNLVLIEGGESLSKFLSAHEKVLVVGFTGTYARYNYGIKLDSSEEATAIVGEAVVGEAIVG